MDIDNLKRGLLADKTGVGPYLEGKLSYSADSEVEIMTQLREDESSARPIYLTYCKIVGGFAKDGIRRVPEDQKARLTPEQITAIYDPVDAIGRYHFDIESSVSHYINLTDALFDQVHSLVSRDHQLRLTLSAASDCLLTSDEHPTRRYVKYLYFSAFIQRLHLLQRDTNAT